MELGFRLERGTIPRWWGDVEDQEAIRVQQQAYNDAIITCNRHIAYLCKRGDSTIRFERLRGLHVQWWSYILADGVHYNHHGQYIYYQNLRRTLITHG